MKRKSSILLLLLLVMSVSSFAQMDKEDREERKAQAKDKVDYNLFRRQMLSLKEYGDERKKIPALQKANKVPVKIVAYVDSTNEGENSKTLIGYIRQDVGDNSTNVYEVTYDRLQKKIITVKPTGEDNGLEKEEDASDNKSTGKKSAHKKNKDDDDDNDDADEEKPSKKKQKDDD